MDLQQLIEKDVSQLSDEELEKYINIMRRLRIESPHAVPKKKVKSNKEKRTEDLVSKLSTAQIQELIKLLQEGKQ